MLGAVFGAAKLKGTIMSIQERLAEYANDDLCKALLKQQEAHLELVEALQCRIGILEKKVNVYRIRHSKCLDFFDGRPELIPPYMESIYAAIDESDEDGLSREDAITEVRYFHESAFDLSTLPCTGADFTPWRD